MECSSVKVSLILIGLSITNIALSQPSPPLVDVTGKVEGNLVTPTKAYQILSQPSRSLLQQTMLSSTGLEVTPEIVELARGLRNDPNLIYKFVHDHIDYTPIWGHIKGANMTLLDRSGNDFDQASLMIALLRQSGYSANYIGGVIRLMPEQIANWLGIPEDPNVIASLLAGAAIPCDISKNPDGTLAYVDVGHVWVKVNIGGTDYVFDPSFKGYSYIAGIDLKSIMGYNSTTFMADATSGATVNSTYVKDINKPNIAADLTAYSTNLINYIKSHNSAATLNEIIGGRNIIPVTEVPWQSSLPYQFSVIYEWAEVPDNYKVSLRIQYQGIDVTVYSCQIYGKILSIGCYYNNGLTQPFLSLDTEIIATGISSAPNIWYPITLTVDHPYADQGGTFCDQTVTFNIISGGVYALMNGWGDVGQNIIQKHRQVLEQNLHAGTNPNSAHVLGESLSVLVLTWLADFCATNRLRDQICDATTINHHFLGVFGEGFFGGSSSVRPYFDLPMARLSIISHNNDISKRNAMYNALGYLSAFEWGVIEQLQPFKSVSTIKLFDTANNNGDKIYDITDIASYNAIKSQLKNYLSWQLTDIEWYINNGNRLILPEDGALTEEAWVGAAYIVIPSVGLGPGYRLARSAGGETATPGAQINNGEIVKRQSEVNNNQGETTSDEPIDLFTGDYLYKQRDITIGSWSYPFSLEFERYHNTHDKLKDGPLGLGWKHNLNLTATKNSDSFQGLGADSPIDAAATIVESYVVIDLFTTGYTNTQYVVTALADKWCMDQLIDNVVNVDMSEKTMQFVKLPDGNYNPPPGEAAKLTTQSDGSYLLRTKHGEYLDFDPNGRITSWSDPNNTVNYTYSINGKLSQVNNGLGRSLNLTYDLNDANHIAYATDSAGRTVHFGYDTKGNLTTFTDANGFTTTFAYDPNNDGLITKIYYPAEPNDPFVINTYDSLSRVVAQTNARGYDYNYFYSYYRTEEVDPCGYSKTYYFNKQGKLLSQEDPLGNKTLYEYDGQLRKILVTQPLGNATRFIYDANHNVLQSIQTPVLGSNEPNLIEIFTYEPNFNRVATYTDPNGRITTFQYYSNGKLKEIDQPVVDGNIPRTLFTYNSHGQTETSTNQEGMVTKYQYDPNGNLISIIMDYGIEPNKLNITTTITYNSIGDANSTTDPRGNKTIFEYDAIRRLVKATAPAPFNYVTYYEYYPDGTLKQLSRQTSDSNQWQVTTYTYTLSGKIESVTDPNDDVTEYEYDALDRLWKTTDAENHITTRLYDDAGRLLRVSDANDNNSVVYTYNADDSIDTLKDAKSNTTTYQYDGHNRLKKTIYPNSTFEQLAYDLAGNISQKQNRGGQTITYTYDPLNRLKTKTLPGPQQIQYAYDLTERLKAVTDSTGTIQHSYDSIGRLVGVTYPDGKNVSYQYDTTGNRLRLTYPDNIYVTYDYDNLNRLTYVRDVGGSMVAHYDYDALSRRTGAQFANGTSATYLYNIADRLFYLNNQMVGNSRSFAYSYDKVGNRLTMTTDGAKLHRYSYDKIYQLTGADYPAGFFAADTNFNYDTAGNRSSVISDGTTNYATNNLNQYTSINGVVYSYDSNGNLTYDGNNTYTYDAENRLITAARTGNNVSYQYDAFGRRISKNVNGTITKYLYDGDQVICEYNGSGKLVRKFLYGTGIDETIRMSVVLPSADMLKDGFVNYRDFAVLAKNWMLDINKSGFDPNADLVADNVINLQDLEALADSWLTNGNRSEDYYYHCDGLGNVIALSDSAGHLAESYAYDVYGRANTISMLSNSYLFTGRQYDAETGLYYYRARYYSPAIGRFLQTDPIGYQDTFNLYAYVNNDPLNWIDPYGLCKEGVSKEPIEIEVDWWATFWSEYLKGAHETSIGIVNAFTFGRADSWGWTDAMYAYGGNVESSISYHEGVAVGEFSRGLIQEALTMGLTKVAISGLEKWHTANQLARLPNSFNETIRYGQNMLQEGKSIKQFKQFENFNGVYDLYKKYFENRDTIEGH